MTWVDYQQFTVFVLTVCVVLSFVLRQMIREITQLRQMIGKELLQFTRHLVNQTPTLENYLKLGLLYFQNREYQKSGEYFNKLLGETVYSKEASYYLVLCLHETGQYQEAKKLLATMNPEIYTEAEFTHLHNVINHPRFLVRVRNFLYRLLLTEVSLPYPLLREDANQARARQIEVLLAAIPTRYRNPELKSEHLLFYEFDALDEHLQRRVSLRVLREQSKTDALEEFLQHPRILAQLHSRSFPQVYDLQQGTVAYYSQELPSGEAFVEALNRLGPEDHPEDFLRCFLAMIRPLWHLEIHGFEIQNLNLSEILYNQSRDTFCIYCLLRPLNPKNTPALVLEILGLLRREALRKPPLLVYQRLQELQAQSFSQLLDGLQSCLEEFLVSQTSNREQLVSELLAIEELHRACIHGLKGKFGIVKRYQNDLDGLLKSFLRTQNLVDIKDKVTALRQKVSQLSASNHARSFSILDELVSIDYDSILQKLDFLAAQYAANSQDSRLYEFLKTQHHLFETLSDSLAEFIERHCLRVSSLLSAFTNGFVEKDRIETSIHPSVAISKLALISPEEMRNSLLIILENLCHNALEARATKIDFRITRQDQQRIRFEVRDNGTGFPPDMLEDASGSNPLKVQWGSTGLVTARALCEGLGGKLSLDSACTQGACVILELPCFVA